MKKAKKICILLLIIGTAAMVMTSCGSVKSASNIVKQRTGEFLNAMILGDRDRMYSLMYPDTVSREAFDITADQLEDRCRIGKGYELKSRSFSYNSSVGENSRKTVTVEYRLDYNEDVYYVNVVYLMTDDSQGFTEFTVTSSKEH